MMQKPEPMMSFVHPVSRSSDSQTGPFDISRQASGAVRRCAKPCCKTRNPVVVQKRMEKRIMRITADRHSHLSTKEGRDR